MVSGFSNDGFKEIKLNQPIPEDSSIIQNSAFFRAVIIFFLIGCFVYAIRVHLMGGIDSEKPNNRNDLLHTIYHDKLYFPWGTAWKWQLEESVLFIGFLFII